MRVNTVVALSLVIVVTTTGCQVSDGELSSSLVEVAKPYPVCFYERDSEHRQDQIEKRLSDAITTYFRSPVRVSFGPQTRYAFVRGGELDHQVLARDWPLIGCVGNYHSSDGLRNYMQCREALRRSISAGGELEIRRLDRVLLTEGNPPAYLNCAPKFDLAPLKSD